MATAAKKALIVWGGWAGHKPEQWATLFRGLLEGHGYDVRVETDLKIYEDTALMRSLNLIVPYVTMGEMPHTRHVALSDAVRSGVGLAGIHGGMCDSFHTSHLYQMMTGGRFVDHPYNGPYTVNVVDKKHPVTAEAPEMFLYSSEQYYLMVDPSIRVLAHTQMEYDDQKFSMPVLWVKKWGLGRVFYNALGHDPAEFKSYPIAQELTLKGLLWASR